MPELPEVETVVNSLKELVLNKTIESVEVKYSRIIQTNLEEFKSNIKDKQILDITRIGKHIIFHLSDNAYLVSHLRMEGKYFLHLDNNQTKHDHIIFKMKDGTYLMYNDTRKFGTMHLFLNTTYAEIKNKAPLNSLGKEPFDEGFTLDYLKPIFNKSNKPIKTVLLDQSIIAGLGNIYADEVLFASRLHPLTKACNLSDNDILNIISSSKDVLNHAIYLGGTTIKSFVSSHMATGLFQNELNVHTKKTCKVCNNQIFKRFVGGRGSYYCLHCQKLNPIVVGLTGSISSGKSLVTSILKELGYKVIDLDKISRELTNNENSIVYKMIINNFDCLTDGLLDRKKLANIIFNDEKMKLKLNEITHPFILKEMEKEIDELKKTESIIFVDCPLLYEIGLEDKFDEVIVVNCDLETQIERLTKRDNITRDYAIKKISSQMPLSQKIKKANFIVDNSKTIEYTKENIEKILEILK